MTQNGPKMAQKKSPGAKSRKNCSPLSSIFDVEAPFQRYLWKYPLFLAILWLFTPCDGSVEAFNTTSRVPYITISLSFDNTWSCAPMVKCIYLKNVRNSGNILFFNHYKIFHTLWWLRGGFQHDLQSPVYSHTSEFR